MKYQKFIIEQYKGIAEPIEINIAKSDEPPIIPIIGTNESGKSTVLYGCFAFDYRNDIYNNQVGHLTECEVNLYRPENKQIPKITAFIRINKEIMNTFIEQQQKTLKGQGKQKKLDQLSKYLACFNNIDEITIEVTRCLIDRNKLTKGYSVIEFDTFEYYQEFIKYFINIMPPIIYFDDFKDSIPKTIYFYPEKKYAVPEDESEDTTLKLSSEGYANQTWYCLLNALFEKTVPNADISELKNIEDIHENTRNSLLKKITNKLNVELKEFWNTIKLDQNLDNITIEIRYNNFHKLGGAITLEIFDGENSFDLEHRSKGFKWFFNFIMKVKYYPSNGLQNNHVLFLLDEPGAYLHPEAQKKLCQHLSTILTQVQNGAIFYTTHSPYLLNPEYISINNIHIVSNNSHNIHLQSYKQSKQGKSKLKNAWQPVYDALKVNSSIQIDCNLDKVILVEGITDFYALKLFLDNKINENNLKIIPCEGAGGIKSQIPYMLAYNVHFVILLDNDKAGNDTLKFIDKHYPHLSKFIIKYEQKLENMVEDLEKDIINTTIQASSIKDSWIPLYFNYQENQTELQKQLPLTHKNFIKLFDENVLSRLNNKSSS